MVIRYESSSSKSPATDEWDCSITIYQDNREIGYASEGTGLVVDGDYRSYIETEKCDENGIPEVEHKNFELSASELLELYQIINYWELGENEPLHLQR